MIRPLPATMGKEHAGVQRQPKARTISTTMLKTPPLLIVVPQQPQHPGEKYQLWFDYSIGDLPVYNDDDYLETYHDRGEDYIINNEQTGQFHERKRSASELKKFKSQIWQQF
jgi:hypothetical protein